MKILFHYMARWKSVNWTRYHSLLTELCNMGHIVYVIQPRKIKSMETNFQEIEVPLPENLKLIDIELPDIIWNTKFPFDKLFKKGIYCLWSKKEVDRIISGEGIDALLLYNIPQFFLARTKKCKVIFDVADDYIPMLAQELGRFSNPLTLALAKVTFQKMMKNSDHILAVSQVLVSDLGAIAELVPNGVSLEKAQSTSCKQVNLLLHSPVVGFVGSFEYFIDFDLIMETVAALPDITFLLVGSGRMYADIRDKIQERQLTNVILTGGVPHQEVFAYIDKMDICLNIFKKIRISHAACPIKMFEYMVMGKPVISTRLQEVEHMNISSLLFADNLSEMKSAINFLLNHPDKAQKLAKTGQDLVLNHYTWAELSKKIIDIIEYD